MTMRRHRSYLAFLFYQRAASSSELPTDTESDMIIMAALREAELERTWCVELAQVEAKARFATRRASDASVVARSSYHKRKGSLVDSKARAGLIRRASEASSLGAQSRAGNRPDNQDPVFGDYLRFWHNHGDDTELESDPEDEVARYYALQCALSLS